MTLFQFLQKNIKYDAIELLNNNTFNSINCTKYKKNLAEQVFKIWIDDNVFIKFDLNQKIIINPTRITAISDSPQSIKYDIYFTINSIVNLSEFNDEN